MGIVWGDAVADMQQAHVTSLQSNSSSAVNGLGLVEWKCTDPDPGKTLLDRAQDVKPICVSSNIILAPIYLGFMLCRSALHVNPCHSAVCMAACVFGYYMIHVGMKGHAQSLNVAVTALLLIGAGAHDTMQCYFKLQVLTDV
jgi:hypothetical protein